MNTKIRFKLRLDGSVLLLQGQLDTAISHVLRQSDAPLPQGQFRSLALGAHASPDPESRLRRQILRAYGTLGEFLRVTGIKPWVLSEVLSRNPHLSNQSPAGKLRARFGLPARSRP